MRELWTLRPFLRPYRSGIAAGLFLVVLANASAILTPELIGRAIDALSRPTVTLRELLAFCGLILLAALLSGASRFGMRQLLNGLSRRIEVDLRDAFFEHLLRLDAAFYGRFRTGDLMSRAAHDTQAVRMAVGPGMMYLVNTVVMTAFALAFMARISPRLTAFAVLPLMAMPPAVLFFGGLIHRRTEAIQEHLGTLSSMVQENLAGARIVRAYVQQSSQELEFDELNRGYAGKNVALARLSGMFYPLLGLLTGLGMTIVLWAGGRSIIDGSVSIGQFVAFGFYLGILTWPMIALGWVINLFQRGAASMRRINRIMETEPAVQDPPEPVRLERVRGEIEFRDVRFRYPGSGRDVLRGVSFHVTAGKTVALVGATGSGKSTIAALLTRQFDPTAGEIRLDGVPLQHLALEQVRGAAGVVPQDAFLFSETIGDNIGFGLPGGEEAEPRVREAAETARLRETIAQFPHGYDTRVGERGITLSGGQRQRATLARALARGPRILVLDDSLSAVDTHTETEILRVLGRVLAGRTAVIISHRVTAVMGADLILVLDHGRIVERGTHARLIAQGGLYATLLRRQLLEEGLEAAAIASDAAGE